jgi:hypothetical protein
LEAYLLLEFPHKMLLPLLRVEVKMMVAKVGTVTPREQDLLGVFQGQKYGFLWVFTFFPALRSCCPPGYHNPTCFLYVVL